MTKTVQVVLLGTGTVGKAVLTGLAASATGIEKRYGIILQCTMVAESDAAMVGTEDDPLDLEDIAKHKSNGGRISGYTGSGQKITGDEVTATALAQAGPERVIIDCTATDSITPVLTTWLQRGGGVVMANKKPVTGPISDFRIFTAPANEPRARFESSVGAGTPFVSTVTRVVKSGDTITSIEGAFSGTLGYLASGLQDGKSLSELVTIAHELGYTEPDPRDDLSGMDVARKALILARTIGWEFELSQVEVEALYPPELASLSVDEFKVALKQSDAAMEDRRAEALSKNCVLRYVASVTKDVLKVGMAPVPKESPLGRLSGTANIMQLVSTIYSDPLVVQGSGAGPEVTAAGVIADLVGIAQTM